jgi:hypothetical protein
MRNEHVPPEKEQPLALLVVPPVYDFALYDLFLRPYGLLRIGAWLKQAGYRIRMVDALDPDDPGEIALSGRAPKRKPNGTGKFFRRAAALPGGMQSIPRRYSRYGLSPQLLKIRLQEGASPDLVCIGSGMTYWYPGVQEVSRLCATLWPDTPVVVGGVYASLLPEHCGSIEGVSLPVADDPGKGGRAVDESALGRLLRKYGLPVPPGSVPCFPLTDPALSRNGAAPLRLNRGCPYRCSYCASSLLEPNWSAGDAEDAFEHVRELYGKYGVRNFAFYDDALLVEKERVLLPFLELATKKLEGVSFWTPNAMHLRLLDRETARLLRRAGFRDVRFGYESDSEEFHREHDGKYVPGEAERAFDALTHAGFLSKEVTLYVLGALPGQKRGELFSAVAAARKSGFSVQVAEYSPVPGSGLWKESVRCARYPIDSEPLYQNNSFMPMEWEGLTRKDLEGAKALAREE